MKEIKIKDISIEIQTGPFGSQLHSSDYSVEGVPVIMPQNIVNFRISEKQIARVDERHVIRLKRHKVNSGDIIFPRRGSFSKCAIISGHEKGWLCGTGCLKIKLNTLKVFPNYVYFALQQPKVIKLIESSTVGSTMPNLNTRILGDVNIPFIPKKLVEQESIAEVLSDVDDLIAISESLLQKKRDIKQGAMQQLLSGKRRLPGFSEPWVNLKIVEFTDIVTGATPNTTISEYWGGDIRWMNSGELNNRHIHDVEGRISQKGYDSTSTSILPKYCVLIGLAGQGKTRGTVAINYIELCTNQSIAAILPSARHNSFFLYALLDSRYSDLRAMSNGDSSRGGLSKRILLNLEVLLPSSIAEQNAIAEILLDFDSEIQTLEGNLAKYKAIRDAMMQQLLTGKIRLI